MSNQRPNILLFMTDQQRQDSLGCYGAHWVDTPNLDRLAAEGVTWDNCYVNNPICTPSRSCMWTGRELPGHGVYRLYDNLPQDQVHFPYHLRQAGYRTALYGKLHTSGRLFEATNRHPYDGFDEYEWGMEASIHLDSPFNGYSRWLQEHHPDFYTELSEKGRNLLHHPQETHFTHWAAERTIDFIRRSTSAGEAPFFCCMSVFDPHNPYEDYPLEMLEYVRAGDMPPPLSDPRRDTPTAIGRERAHSYLGDYETFTAEDINDMRVGYFASIALIDIEIGRVLKALEETGAADNTLVLYVSDHGDMLGDHDLVVKGAYFYDACTKVPFLMRWPARIPAGGRRNALVQPHDIAATVLSAAGILPETENPNAGEKPTSAAVGTPTVAASHMPTSVTAGMPSAAASQMPTSVNLLPLAAGETTKAHDYAVCAYRNSGICDTKRPWDPAIYGTMIHDGRYKLSVYHKAGQFGEPAPANRTNPGGAGTGGGGTGGANRSSTAVGAPGSAATVDPQADPATHPEGELYDLERDPQELHNLFDDPVAAAVRLRLTEAMAEWMFLQERAYLGSRGGQQLPEPKDQLDNTLKGER